MLGDPGRPPVAEVVLGGDDAHPSIELFVPAAGATLWTSVCADGSCGGAIAESVVALHRDGERCRVASEQAPVGERQWAVRDAGGVARAWVARRGDGTVVLLVRDSTGRPAEILVIPGDLRPPAAVISRS